ncbi:NACHT, LRR and PYD domains-containing protein 12-like [Sphaeramia orbicularis]|uniref:NACHT, LRR and PYD domains-containing protein 12-like n=1 Tax=Sphaeramia orbicularis TaxID=375764 RepID=UPI00117CF937|nr:NACHT, LRR and PYD domains-containing protein 12-like [Sphaeramia orbicularis]
MASSQTRETETGGGAEALSVRTDWCVQTNTQLCLQTDAFRRRSATGSGASSTRLDAASIDTNGTGPDSAGFGLRPHSGYLSYIVPHKHSPCPTCHSSAPAHPSSDSSSHPLPVGFISTSSSNGSSCASLRLYMKETQMAALEESLLNILEDLNHDEFKTFKWFLKREKPRIPVSKLENADRTDTVDLMVQTYYTNTQSVTVRVLQKMKKNDLVKELLKDILVSKDMPAAEPTLRPTAKLEPLSADPANSPSSPPRRGPKSIDQCRRKLKTIISHIKTSRSVHIMCHIPVFCWITANVLEDVLKTTEGGELPKTLTEMYIHFLVVQAKLKNVKYNERSGTDSPWSPETRKMIESLGKLAFEQLKKGNLIFYESDLTECGIDISSGSAQTQFYQTAVDQALQSPNGHLDLFLRFLLGLSLQTNQRLLHGLMKQTGSSSETNQETAEYIKKKLNDKLSVEKSINLFHCLNELEDRSLVDQIQQYLRDGSLYRSGPSPAQWSALVFMLLSSDKDLDEFDLNKYHGSEEALLNLLPVVKASNKAVLTVYGLSQRGFEGLSSVLRSQSSSLRHLDLSTNNLEDSGLKILSDGLRSPDCKLETLRLSICNLSERSCEGLSSVLRSQSCSLTHLELNNMDLKDSGQKILSDGLRSPDCKLETLRWRICNLSERSCEGLSSGLRSQYSSLTLLDLDNMDLKDSGLKILSDGLRSPDCKLETLRLSGCLITEEGCSSLLDPNTANEKLKLSENNKKVEGVEEVQSYPDHQDRFEGLPQLMCSTGLTGRCYWEVQWSGEVWIAVTYRGIRRKGKSEDCGFGFNDQSWSLWCYEGICGVSHNNKYTDVPRSSFSDTVSVYVDCPAGSVSFYRVCSDKLIHIYTFKTTFTDPLFAGFTLHGSGSTVSLCDV